MADSHTDLSVAGQGSGAGARKGRRGRLLRAAAALFATGAIGLMSSGCLLAAVAAKNYQETQTRSVDAEYLGLADKSFAVVVSADRSIQGRFPALVGEVTVRMTQRLANAENVPKAGGFVPPDQVLRFQANSPGWTALPFSELAEKLGGVDRLVVVDIFEYRLHDPGNQYTWDGVAAGTVSVIEADSGSREDFAWQRAVRVKFPDESGMGPEQMEPTLVQSALLSRFIDRAAWAFYKHEEPYEPKY